MHEISANFSPDEMRQIQELAKRQGLSPEQLVEQATIDMVVSIKNNAKAELAKGVGLKIVK